MSKFLRYSLLVLTLMSLALSSVAHANAPDHDAVDCSVCIYQPNTELQTCSTQLSIPESRSISEQVQIWTLAVIVESSITPFDGRAPPYIA